MITVALTCCLGLSIQTGTSNNIRDLLQSRTSKRCLPDNLPGPLNPQVEPLTIPVLYETDRVLAVQKPAGIPHHDQDGEWGILSHLRYCQKQHGGIGGNQDNMSAYGGRLYGVHRLDRVTSGILLLAKDADAASDLSRSFREGSVVKYYIGLSGKKPKKKQGWVRGNMVRGRRKSWYLTRDLQGDNVAKTRFFTTSLASLQGHLMLDGDDSSVQTEEDHTDSQSLQRGPRTCLLFRPYTGRTHQLRVAAKSLGLPLLGDPIYRDGSVDASGCPPLERTYLHASAIHIRAGGTVFNEIKDISIWSPPPFFLWDDIGMDQFKISVTELMENHCDCEPIRNLL